ncbi:hypothetical protein [Saccharopolyspora hattusasensis]|uniref:hypothetical protein n=1 Tax=Saccharopolyspora hattusasensis TaxID=1128679 RepID=UPI003D969DD0
MNGTSFSPDELAAAMNDTRDEMERQLDLSDRETGLLNFLITASTMRLRGVTDLNEVINEQYVREDEHADAGYSQDVRINGRQLVWADDSTGPEAAYELRLHAALADFLRKINEINPETRPFRVRRDDARPENGEKL